MSKGFTLLELLIVIAIIGILSYLSLPMGLTFFRSQAVESARNQLIEAIEKAKHNAYLQKFDSNHGVYIDSVGGNLNSFTVYRGNSYNSRTTSDDELYEQAPNLSISGDTAFSSGDINFSKLTGLPSATGTLIITNVSGESNEGRSILIDYFGNVTKN